MKNLKSLNIGRKLLKLSLDMTFFIAHRINNLESLSMIGNNVGIEIDIREDNEDIILAHDPFMTNDQNKVKLTDILPFFETRFLIVNVKSERIEERFIEISKNYLIKNNYFFLDSSISVINQYYNNKDFIFCSRYSEYESLLTTKNLVKNKLTKWIWIDVFNKLPIDKEISIQLNNIKAKKCLTSPCLLGRENDIKEYAKIIKRFDLNIDAICCKYKNINLWKNYLS